LGLFSIMANIKLLGVDNGCGVLGHGTVIAKEPG